MIHSAAPVARIRKLSLKSRLKNSSLSRVSWQETSADHSWTPIQCRPQMDTSTFPTRHDFISSHNGNEEKVVDSRNRPNIECFPRRSFATRKCSHSRNHCWCLPYKPNSVVDYTEHDRVARARILQERYKGFYQQQNWKIMFVANQSTWDPTTMSCLEWLSLNPASHENLRGATKPQTGNMGRGKGQCYNITTISISTATATSSPPRSHSHQMDTKSLSTFTAFQYQANLPPTHDSAVANPTKPNQIHKKNSPRFKRRVDARRVIVPGSSQRYDEHDLSKIGKLGECLVASWTILPGKGRRKLLPDES